MKSILVYNVMLAYNKIARRTYIMSYVDEVYELVVAKNPAQPEFHQAVYQISLKICTCAICIKNTKKLLRFSGIKLLCNFSRRNIIFLSESILVYNVVLM